MNKIDSDHDVLVRLEANFNTFTKQYAIDIKDVKDGYTQKFANHETRILVIEKVHEQIDPIKITREFREVQQEVHDFKSIWKFVVSFAILLGSIVTFILNSIAKIMGWLT